jgi:hypothetical protein
LRHIAEFLADLMVNYALMIKIKLSALKPICLAAAIACAIACAPSHDDNGAGSAAAATTKAAAPEAADQMSAQTAAERIKAAIPEVSLITITGDNAANNMIGRSTGYVAATVIVDSRTGEECDPQKPGIVCGAGVEQWPDAAAAQQRADYLKTVPSAMPIVGTEYATLRGNLLLRVSGKLNPSVADQYKAAFSAA